MQTPARTPGPDPLDALHVMADVWRPDVDRHTEVGALVAAAKDDGDAAAKSELAYRLAAFVATADVTPGVVVPVPAAPRGRLSLPSLPGALAAAVGALDGFTAGPGTLERGAGGPRVRDVEPAGRAAVVAAADYRVVADVRDATVVIVDDVVLTGATLAHLAGLLRAAGATRVEAIVAARSRRSR